MLFVLFARCAFISWSSVMATVWLTYFRKKKPLKYFEISNNFIKGSEPEKNWLEYNTTIINNTNISFIIRKCSFQWANLTLWLTQFQLENIHILLLFHKSLMTINFSDSNFLGVSHKIQKGRGHYNEFIFNIRNVYVD